MCDQVAGGGPAAGAGLGWRSADPEDLTVPVGVDAGGDHDRDLDDPTADTIARWTWREMNQPVFERHVEAAASEADVVVDKGDDHSVTEVLFLRT